jgi:hypothetical protein
MIQRFLLETLNPSLNESVQVRRLWADWLHTVALSLKTWSKA